MWVLLAKSSKYPNHKPELGSHLNINNCEIFLFDLLNEMLETARALRNENGARIQFIAGGYFFQDVRILCQVNDFFALCKYHKVPKIGIPEIIIVISLGI